MHLPFPPGHAWRVIQGIDDPEGSHNGFAAFCWDFVFAEDPAATPGQPVLTAGAGRITFVEESRSGSAEFDNLVMIEQSDDSWAGYLHIANQSHSGLGLFGSPQDEPEWLRPFVQPGVPIARVGSAAAHLHFAVTNVPDIPPEPQARVTVPVAFSDYDVSNDNGRTWLHVERGVPSNGQLVRSTFVPLGPVQS
jgi:murein DD-endopeptidase MepM/ murein hydrolase activator NlpD